MNNGSDQSQSLADQVKAAFNNKTPLRIVGGNSKFFYGRPVQGETLSLSEHTGIIDYQPTELVITARSGTPINEIERTLAEHNQMLGFEPPCHTDGSTLGGCIASGLSGPRRPFAGAVRDFVLGTRIINGKGESLRFGGQVMKNVAGYDVSRLMAGSQGTLGVILEASIKVQPVPESELTLNYEMPFETAQDNLTQWIGKGYPVTASGYFEGRLSIRISSTESNTTKTQQQLGGDRIDDGLWHQLRHQTHPFFANRLWRVSVPATTERFMAESEQLIEWSCGLRWIKSDKNLRTVAEQYGGHAIRYVLNKDNDDVFHPLPAPMLSLHKKLKHSFDPENILNPGRMYPDL